METLRKKFKGIIKEYLTFTLFKNVYTLIISCGIIIYNYPSLHQISLTFSEVVSAITVESPVNPVSSID